MKKAKKISVEKWKVLNDEIKTTHVVVQAISNGKVFAAIQRIYPEKESQAHEYYYISHKIIK